MKKKSGTDAGRRPAARRVPLPELVIDTGTELFELVVGAGLTVVQALLEDDRVALCGPRYAHGRGRRAYRAGTTASELVLGGRKVGIDRPRVRADGREVLLPTFARLAATDALDRRVVEPLLVGVATRRYARSLESIGGDLQTRGTSKSAVSRRFVAQTRGQVEAWQTRSLDDLDLVVLLIDGVYFAKHCLVAALGIDTGGAKHVLGLWDGSTENTVLCRGLLANLMERGLRTDRSLLVVLDGSKALRKAVEEALGRAGWVQRCQVHKMRNVLGYLPEHRRSWARAVLQRAYHSADRTQAQRRLEGLARQLEAEYPSAAASLRDGLEESLTVLELPIGETLRRSLATTNTIENFIGRLRAVHHNVKRWRGRDMALRWATAGAVEAAQGFQRVQGHRDLRTLIGVLRARDERLGLSAARTAA